MESRAYAALTVVFVIALAGGAAYLLYWLQAAAQEDRIYYIDSRHDVDGLQSDARVTYKGLLVGHVKRLRFHPDDPDRVRIRLGLRDEAPVTRSTYAELATKGITGQAYIALHKDPEGRDAPVAGTPEEPAVIPMRRSTLQRVMADAGDIAEGLDTVTARVAALVDEPQRRRIERILASTERAVRRFEAIEGEVQGALEDLPAVMAEAETALREGRTALARIRRLAATAETEARRAGEAASAVEDLGEAGTGLIEGVDRELVPDIGRAAAELARAARRLRELGARLERQPQSVIFGPSPPPPGPGEPGFDPDTAGEEPR